MHKATKLGRPAKGSTALQGKRGLTESIVAFANAQSHPVTKVFAARLADHFKTYMAKRLLNGEAVSFDRLGSLQVRQRAGRVGVNPKTLEKLQIPPKRTVTFSVSHVLKDALNHKIAYPFPGTPKPNAKPKKAAAPKAKAPKAAKKQ